MASISLRNVSKSYQRHVSAVQHLTLEVARGSYAVIVGSSGCGKTTTLRLIAGLEHPDSGDIMFDGRTMGAIGADGRDIAMVFQSESLYPHLTVRGNLAFPLLTRRMPRDEIEQRIAAFAHELGISEWLDRKPDTLSAGQQQRVALGRALIREPSIVLLDEPLANLDPAARTSMRELLKSVQRRHGCTVVHVTHDQDEAMRMADSLMVMHGGQLAQSGAPRHIHDSPIDRFTASFIGEPAMNFVDGRLEMCGDSACFVEAAGSDGTEGFTMPLHASVVRACAGRMGQSVVLGVRPHRLHIANDGSESGLSGARIPFTVDHVEYGSQHVDVRGHTQTGHPMTIRLETMSAPERMTLSLAPTDVMLFEPGPRGLRLWPSEAIAYNPQDQ